MTGSEGEMRALRLESGPTACYGIGVAHDPRIGFRARVTARVMDGPTGGELFRREYRHIRTPVGAFAGGVGHLVDAAADSLGEAIVADLLGRRPPSRPDPLWAWRPQGTTWIVDGRHFDRSPLPGAPEWYR
jgi:hypothetical protein